MSPTHHTRKVTLVGGTGTIGSPILTSLLAKGHTVRAITRADSTSTFPPGVDVRRGAYSDAAFLASALAGQDVLIMALSFSAYDAQVPLIRAAAAAGVRYVLPTEFGFDLTNARVVEAMPMMSVKKQYRDLVEELGGVSSCWIGVVNNPWFEFTMGTGMLGVDLRGRKAVLLDDDGDDGDKGPLKAVTTTLARVGESVAALLALPEEELAAYKNGWVYFGSFVVSQRELLQSAARATGTDVGKDWEVTHKSAKDVLSVGQEAMQRGDMIGGQVALMAITFSEGYGGDYSAKMVDYERLGLQPEHLDESMRKVVESLGLTSA